jgi:hypothetical protein
LPTVNPSGRKKWSGKTAFAFKLELENYGVGDSMWPSQKTTLALPQ